MSDLSPGARLGLGTGCCPPPLERGRDLCPWSEWGQVLGAPYVRGRPRDHRWRRWRAAEGSLCFPSHSVSQRLLPHPDPWAPLIIMVCSSLLGCCDCFYPRFSLPNWTLEQICQIGQNMDKLADWLEPYWEAFCPAPGPSITVLGRLWNDLTYFYFCLLIIPSENMVKAGPQNRLGETQSKPPSPFSTSTFLFLPCK